MKFELKTISEVADILDIKPYVMRFWEKQFSFLTPIKHAGRRLYNEEEINKLKNIKFLLYEKGYKIKALQEGFDNLCKLNRGLEAEDNVVEDIEKLEKILLSIIN